MTPHPYPETRFMGSKEKLTGVILGHAARFGAETFVDVFSGSGVVAHAAKTAGYRVVANDQLAFSAVFTRAMVENSTVVLGGVDALLAHEGQGDRFVQETYTDLYYTAADALAIDRLRDAISHLDGYEQAIATAALVRACLKKRPRGIFTYTGLRYDDGRRDLQMSIAAHFAEQVAKINAAVFDNGRACESRHGDFRNLAVPAGAFVYLDPPYWSPASDNHYVRRYHFVEGVARGWEGVEIQEHTKTKKFANYPTPFSTLAGATDALGRLFTDLRDHDLMLSYSSNSLPDKDTILGLFADAGRGAELIEIDHRYSFSTRTATKKNKVQEYLFVSPKAR
ncbi:DNA adenine methylase [Corynebacterium guangdongense]|uniref:DNA adenine methylase n=1 Tax=Corynebacterium guangdongense TaxID=1783348 RepID=A0ABU1ZYJ9_9CORY|nr:DNA adenine methylase [Corynebacterium guangdongense]MDR7330017.1 DNA adenine methylase [Corynebacterium guangdongense]